MRGRAFRLAILPAVVMAVGCQTAPRYVSQGPDEGIIALPSDTPANRQAAEKLMAAHFPGGFDVVYEYEQRIGETTHRIPDSQVPGGPPVGVQPAGGVAPYGPGIQRPRSRLETVEKSEIRIRYRRQGATAIAPVGGTSIADVLPQK